MDKKTVERVGFGIFGWSGDERRSDRYGGFFVGSAPYESPDRVAAHLDVMMLRPLVGKRVHVWCKVVQNRDSGHVGDMFHNIRPTKPNVDEIVDLGVAELRLGDAGFDGLKTVIMRPEDGRDTFWIDPRKLYRLHDQTVDVFVEETAAEFSPAPVLGTAANSDREVIETGDGAFQAKGSGLSDGDTFHVESDVQRMGDGLFIITPPSGMEAGRRRKMIR